MNNGIQHVAFAALCIAVCSSALYSQHYTLGMSADITTSGSPLTANPSTGLGTNPYEGSYGTYPTVTLAGHGERSSIQSSYSYGVSRSLQTEGSVSRSHLAMFNYSTPAGPKWGLTFSDSFEQAINSSTFRLFRGDTLQPDTDTPQPELFNYIFDVQLNDARRTNTINGSMSRQLNEHGSLTFGATHSLLIYDNVEQYNGTLSNQQRLSVNAGYSQSQYRGGWNVGYFGTISAFQTFATSRTHAVHIGFSRQISRSMSLQVNGGPSYAGGPNIVHSQLSGDASIQLHRSVHNGGFSLSYTHAASDTSGYGSIADNQDLTLQATHTFGRSVSLSLDLAAFDSRGKTVAAYTTRGYSAGGNFSYSVGRYWSMNFGAQYQHYQGNTFQGGDQKRIFASVRYHSPELWRF